MILTYDITNKRSRENQGYDNGKRLYMVNQYLSWSLIVMFMLTHCSVRVQGVQSFCMAPPVELGKAASISCHFGEDISRIQQDVVVYIYKDNGRKPVVQYAWFDGQFKILQENGYVCDETISEYLVVRIPHTTREHAAQYSCIVAPSEKKEVKPCTLRLIDGSTTTQAEHIESVHKSDAVSSSTLQISEFETSPSKGKGTQERDEVNGEMSVIIVLSIVLGILVTLLAITCLFLRKKFRKKAKRWIFKYIPGCCIKSGIATSDNDADVPFNDKQNDKMLVTNSITSKERLNPDLDKFIT